MTYTEVAIRLILAFFIMLVLTRVMGKKEIGKLNVFTFITAITIGNIAASLVTDRTLKIGHGVFSVVGWGLLTILLGYISLKSVIARKIIEGEPKLIIYKGKIMEKTLGKTAIDINSLRGLLRGKNITSLVDVESAILELDGSLSVVKKQDIQQSSKIKAPIFPLSTGVIQEGKLNEENLASLSPNEDWLTRHLNNAGVNSIKDVFYAEVQPDGTLYIDLKNDNE
ncbi:hypothetical protein AM500_19655 [Bacillus sp. FJAT-18017]|uniref:YetF domain-containing protein n=1 Tax=Bacillus sp. FJAT-18017 TaxID=1705566 RepID=UPI0006B03BBE|nr:DUF421 domain-containing protein [Bacillus sp. FJAT-18017]ALC92913.1 hypothetical protein AM500_19655 [Bacillus sp. FJAT-18017]